MEPYAIADAGLVTVSLIIDTDYILKNFPDAGLNKRGAIRLDAGVLSMLADMKSVVSGYNSHNLKIKANIGDVIVFGAEPKLFLSKECIQVYRIVPCIGRLDILPCSNQEELLFPDCNKPEAKKFMAMVKRKGLEQIEVRFSVYTLADDGANYNFHGTFYCDLLGLEVQ